MEESEEKLKSPVKRVKEESEKAGLKLSIQKAKIMASSPVTSWQIEGEKVEAVTDFIFLLPKSPWMVTTATKLKSLVSWKVSYDKPRQHVRNQRHHLANKHPCSQSYDFSSSHVQIWELEHKEGWALKNWFFWIMGLEKTLESSLDFKEIKPVNPKGNQPWIFIGRTDAEAEYPTLWPPDVKSWHIRKDGRRGAGKDGRQKEKGAWGWDG